MKSTPADERHPEKFPTFSLVVCGVAILAALVLSYAPIREKLDRIASLVVPFRRKVYEAVAVEFARFGQ